MAISVGQISISDLNDVYVASLSTETGLVSVSETGTPLSTVSFSTTMYVYLGNVLQTGWTFSRTQTNLTTSINSSTGVLTITGIGANTGFADITASKSGEASLVKRYTLTKVYQGQSGEDVDPALVIQIQGDLAAHGQELIEQAGDIANHTTAISTLTGRVTTAEGTITSHASSIQQTSTDINLTVARLETSEANIANHTSQISQNAESITLRVEAVDTNGNGVVGARIEIESVDGAGQITLDADKILLNGSVKADKIDVDGLFAEEITMGSSGVIKSQNYAESAGNPTQGYSLISSSGELKAVNAVLKNSSLSGSFSSSPMDILESLGDIAITSADTGATLSTKFAVAPAGYVAITGYPTASSGTLKHQNTSITAKQYTIPNDAISRLPNGTLLSMGSTKQKSTNNGATWTTLTPPSLPANPAPYQSSWTTVTNYALRLIGDGVWAFERTCYETWTESGTREESVWVAGYYEVINEPPDPPYSVWIPGYWDTQMVPYTETQSITFLYVYVYSGGAWKNVYANNYYTTMTDTLAGYAYGTRIYLVAEGIRIYSTNTGTSWTVVSGTMAKINQTRFIGFSETNVMFLYSTSAYRTVNGSSYTNDTSIKSTSELINGSTVFFNMGTYLKSTTDGNTFTQINLSYTADCVGVVNGKYLIKSGTSLYLGLAWDAMVKVQATQSTSWKLGIVSGTSLIALITDGYYTVTNVQSTNTVDNTAEIYWIRFGASNRYLKIFVKQGTTLYELLVDTTSGSVSGYEITTFRMAGGIKLKKTIQVVGSDVDLGTLRSITATTINSLGTSNVVWGAVFN